MMEVTLKDMFEQILDNEYRLVILEYILQQIIDKMPDLLTEDEFSKIKDKSFAILESKYPKAGIKKPPFLN